MEQARRYPHFKHFAIRWNIAIFCICCDGYSLRGFHHDGRSAWIIVSANRKMFKMQISPRLFHAAMRSLYSFWSRRFPLPEYIRHSSLIHPDEVSASPGHFSSLQLSPLLSRGKLYQNSNTPVLNIRAHLALPYLLFPIHLSREFISVTVHLISKLSGRVIQFIEMQWITELDVYRETAPVCWWCYEWSRELSLDHGSI